MYVVFNSGWSSRVSSSVGEVWGFLDGGLKSPTVASVS